MTVKVREQAYSLTARQRRYLPVKRAMDFLIALALLLVLAIPMAVIALIQKLTDPHEPVLFRHERIGRDGKPFTLTKFRSMKSSAPQYMAAGYFANSEEYITRFGRLLRSTSLDEVPQLFQVLTGKMSLIGPRPLIAQEERVHELRKAAGVYQLRPGMTGWAQVNGRDLVTDEDKAAYDREYLENVAFAMDWKIFWVTVKKVLLRMDIKEGAHVDRDNKDIRDVNMS